ncbi:MAG: phage tail sheath family protein [Deltaproteobacteria bacterium]|nr:MAG: phage tail sheath family protein [Deltaproteobacteria bacterium]
MALRPGIIVQHASETVRESSTVRSDILGVIGVVTRRRWPRGLRKGDFLEVQLFTFDDFDRNPAKELFDASARRAVQSFFENGGEICHLFGLLIESEQDLQVPDPFEHLMAPLIDRLRGEEGIALVSMPCLAYLPVMYEGRMPVVTGEPILQLLLQHCHEMNNRFLIIDPPRELHDHHLRQWVEHFRTKNRSVASFGAVYYPWLKHGDEEFPPSGAVAGVYSRLERKHNPFGVRWPPANESIVGVTHPAVELRWSETGPLMEGGINPIIIQPTRGVVIWGARTLSKERNWLHINSRRIVSYISEQLRRDSEWAVFENQTPELWATVARICRGRLDQMWSQGMLTGEVAGQDYLVQCDAQTNPPSLREAGQVNVRIRLRPISTTEYILVELRLGADGAPGEF